MSGSQLNSQIRLLPQRRLVPLIPGFGRGVALFFAVFTMLNLCGETVHRGFDASVWSLGLRGIPSWISTALMLSFSVLLFEFACRPAGSRATNRLQKLAVIAACLVARETLALWAYYARPLTGL
ncbi:MAG: hypothetical protein HQ518_02935 [Rhodopirellula sp.]|nr:hypothetical protein [Rhodopirellula sp.]